ncbi:hypothetical protein Zmor_024066 [Zophobas morio]|uniref:Uncharacterized protein n=1 Tax=Zophobas morio TaxID=2755281 RepID=A0AA38HY86_9CUCU|nr:hypothetical protein Zmor_024066 [Zophobas morio]
METSHRSQKHYLSKSFRLSESPLSSYLGSRHLNPLRIYRTLLRPKLGYGAVAYSACRTRLLTPLITLQNIALRIALGAFHTSPVISLYSIANEPPLLCRFKYLQLSFAANTSRNRKTPALQYVFTDRLTITPTRKRGPCFPVLA